MSAYQIVDGVVEVTAASAATISHPTVVVNFAGSSNITVLKVSNASATTAAGLTFDTTGPLVASGAETVILPGATEFIQVASANNTAPIYIWVSGADLYVQPVIVG